MLDGVALLYILNNLEGLWLQGLSEEVFKAIEVLSVLVFVHAEVEIDDVQELFLEEIKFLQRDAANEADEGVQVVRISVVLVNYEDCWEDKPVDRQGVYLDCYQLGDAADVVGWSVEGGQLVAVAASASFVNSLDLLLRHVAEAID